MGADIRLKYAVERTYVLADRQMVVSGAELQDASREDHFRFFATFAGGLPASLFRRLCDWSGQSG